VPLGRLSPQGFYSLKCAVCSDYKERGVFKFDGDTVGYNCFNCGTHAKFEEGSGKISRGMRRVLNAFGVDDTDISDVVNSAFFFKPKENATVKLADLKKVNTHTPPVKLPLKVLPLGGTSEFLDYQQKLVEYLLSRRIDLDRYKFFFSLEDRFLNRVIIPFYRNGNLIFWQARAIEDGVQPRYDSYPGSKEAVLFNFDQLHTFSSKPLLVVEGVFDAMPFDGVATLGSKLNDAKIQLLQTARRRLIFVIDKDKNGRQLAEHALSLGWEITFVPDGANDINKSVQRFGFAWTAYQLVQNVRSGSEAQLAISMRCK